MPVMDGNRTTIGAQPVRTVDAIARRISQAIVDGTFPPGSRLREMNLAEAYDVSRTPVREALVMLSAQGLVELSPNRGATVLELTADDIADVYLVRGVLEAEAARLAAAGPTPELLDTLEESCARLATLHDAPPGEQLAADTAFHYAIAAASGSARLHAMIRQISALPEAYRSMVPYTPDDMRAAEQQHRSVAAAVAGRQSRKAADAMRAHVAWSCGLAVARVASRPAPGRD